MTDCAVIFDVDGVLLELTRDEEELFFTALSKFVATENLSRDWNSYSIRNDEDIIAEILERNHLPAALKDEVKTHYISVLKSSAVRSVAIEGAASLLETSATKAQLGIATANLLEAAQHRLQQSNLWEFVSAQASGADGGGHKSAILARTLAGFSTKPRRVIYIGDNLNDLDAALVNDVTFIGFSESLERRNALHRAGARYISENHRETTLHLEELLA